MSVISISFYVSNILLADMVKPNKVRQMSCRKINATNNIAL